uniref:SFRICE_034103 n=1 Tax=Spodoptera frugiperda TaxID=7108 RepID=A0A2H1WMF3_SPOFR
MYLIIYISWSFHYRAKALLSFLSSLLRFFTGIKFIPTSPTGPAEKEKVHKVFIHNRCRWMQIASNQPIWKSPGEAYVQQWTSCGLYDDDVAKKRIVIVMKRYNGVRKRTHISLPSNMVDE